MGYSNIHVESDGSLTLVEVRRPDKLNALNDATLIELTACSQVCPKDTLEPQTVQEPEIGEQDREPVQQKQAKENERHEQSPRPQDPRLRNSG